MSDGPALSTRVTRIMTPDVATLPAAASVDEAARIIVANHVSGMPVVDETGAVVGVVSLTDIVRAISGRAVVSAPPPDDAGTAFYDPARLDHLVGELLDEGGAGAGKRVGDIMSTRLISVADDAPARDAARLMAKHRVHRVLVVDSVGKLVGIVTALDVVELAAT